MSHHSERRLPFTEVGPDASGGSGRILRLDDSRQLRFARHMEAS
jgi:hypothetical protein